MESSQDILCLHFLASHTSHPFFNQLPLLPALLWNSCPKSNLQPPNYQLLMLLLLKPLVTFSLKLITILLWLDSRFSFCLFAVFFMCLTSSVDFHKVLSSSLLILLHQSPWQSYFTPRVYVRNVNLGGMCLVQEPAWMWAEPTGFLDENPDEGQGMAVDEGWEAWKGDSLLLNLEQGPCTSYYLST